MKNSNRKRKALIIVDVQRDFVDGSLGSKNAQEMIPRLVKKLEGESPTTDFFFTMDTHGRDYLNTQEGKKLPVPHCIENTEGWGIHSALKDFVSAKNSIIVKKEVFGAIGLYHDLHSYDEIELVGLCTDICVVSNALILRSQIPNIEISVDALCCTGTSLFAHLAALKVMQSCQITVKNFPEDEEVKEILESEMR